MRGLRASVDTRLRKLVVAVVPVIAAAMGHEAIADSDAERAEFFEKRVRPVLAEHCFECHSGEASPIQAGLRVDHIDGMLRGGDSGASVVPGAPEESLLIDAVRYETYEMPPRGKLPDEEVEALARWIEDGAYWPGGENFDSEATSEVFDLAARKRSHWAWQPIVRHEPPAVEDEIWSRSELDRFVLAKLEAEGLPPAPRKEKHALVRRAYYDLTGLPPTPEETASFVADDRPDALARVVDRLLASERFGERWGRHWLDLMRYAESRGHEYDFDIPNAYQYRDYVIRALNEDVPYDQLVREHIAGDLLPTPRLNREHGFNESVLGTGFWHLGEWVHSPVDTRKDEADRFDNMIDVMTKSFLGITVSCARCHDHKFDAISSQDYHALAGFLQSSDYRQVRFETSESNRAIADQVATVDDEHRSRLRRVITNGLSPASSGALSGARPVADHERWFAECRVLVAYGNESTLMQDGYAFGTRPRRPGDLLLREDGGEPSLGVAEFAAATADPFWAGLVNHTEDAINGTGVRDPIRRSGRTLRTPTVPLSTGSVACLVRGGGEVFACVNSHRMVRGPLHNETVQRFDAGEDPSLPRWVTMDLRRYAGERVHFEFVPDDDHRLEVVAVVEGSPPDAPPARREPTRLSPELLDRWADDAIQETAELHEAAAAVRAILHEPGRYLRAEAVADLRSITDSWAEERRKLAARVRRDSRVAVAMMDLTGEDDRRLVRGNTESPAELVPRRFLEAIDGDLPLSIPEGSGRLELAERINASDNPLTTRVLVNRVWRHLMGEGLVPTPDNFGVLGEPPTHPELLDHLACEFIANGQSIKSVIRSIVLSSTYAMSPSASAESSERDPVNRLWSRVPPKRLEAEPLRDALLMLAGKLDTTMYGESVPVHLTAFMTGRGRPDESGPRDGGGRRSIYLEVRRNFLSPQSLAFDAPTPFSTMGRRTRANVPAQALVLLNDPFVHECASGWAKRLLQQEPNGVEERIDLAFSSGFGRPPTTGEASRVATFVESEAAARGLDADHQAVWTAVTHALINAKEFIYLP